jgi:hypothetical protein
MVTGSAPGKSSSFLVWVLVVLVPVCALTWWISDIFLPVYRWTEVDFKKIAVASGKAEADLQKTYKLIVRHAPRFANDPIPWQIVTSEPAIEEEEKILVRATIISDRTGRPISQLYLGSGSRIDQYWHVTAWRLPPGTNGFNAHRPVVLYDGSSLTKAGFGESAKWEETLGSRGKPVSKDWSDDDDEVEDGTVPATDGN